MKYKDLNIGDWFEVDGHKYIKCDYDGKRTVGVILDNETIGTVRVFFDDETVVNFLTELHYVNPKQNIDTETIIKKPLAVAFLKIPTLMLILLNSPIAQEMELI